MSLVWTILDDFVKELFEKHLPVSLYRTLEELESPEVSLGWLEKQVFLRTTKLSKKV